MPSIPPAGYSPASAFSLVGFARAQDPVPILADAIDPATGEYTSIEDSATIADGLVVTLMRTRRDSGAAVLGVGQRFSDIRNVDGNTPVLAESLIREALAPAITTGIVQIASIDAAQNDSDPTQVDTGFDYLDLLAAPDDAQRSFPQ